MKKLLVVALGVAGLATFGTTSAFAQAYGGVYGTGNIVPNITPDNPVAPDNPLGMVRYKFSTGLTERTERFGTMNETGLSAFAQAPATVHRRAVHRRLGVTPSPR
jgi:hypothetical protein